MTPTPPLRSLLRDVFGHPEFRPGQEAVVEHVASGRDALVVMPTGAGKSLCYQLPALARDGFAVVVSPLIALMKDQVDQLRARGIAAVSINSSLDEAERQELLAAAARGEAKLVYVAPERFRGGGFARRLAASGQVSLLVIDEAHCLSEWGHDFRPDYLRLGTVRKELGDPPCVALTATATATVRDDIVKVLGLTDPGLFVTGFDRPNISLEAVRCRSRAAKDEALLGVLGRVSRPALVYAATRKSVERVAELLGHRRERCGIYHAGLDPEARTRIQDEFMGGKVPLVVATNAFGMGIDKADLRSVVHYEMPQTLEAYYQEIGRAGRDGRPAQAVLLHARGDRWIQEFFIDQSHPPEWVVVDLWEALVAAGVNPVFSSLEALAKALPGDVSERTVGAALGVLEREGRVRRLAIREGLAGVRFLAGGSEPPRRGLPATLWEALLALRGRGGDRIEGSGPVLPAEAAGTEAPDSIAVDLPALAARLEVARDRIGDGLRALAERGLVEWTPGPRCAGTLLLEKDAPLGIDFEPLKRRRAHELAKLDLMEHYAEGAGCRRRALLEYFGEEPAFETCGRCDVCAAAPGTRAGPQVLAGEAETLVRKALSCVARMGGGHSAGMIARVLTGSKEESVGSLGFDRLSTWGILGELTQPEATELLDALERAGCLEGREIERPIRGRPVRYRILELTELGGRVMRRQAEGFAMVFPPVGPFKDQVPATPRGSRGREPAPREAPLDGEARRRFERLRDVRKKLAEEEGAPPYTMGGNKLLETLARHRPRSRAEMLALPGMGEKMFDRVGSAYLAALEDEGEAG